MTKTPNRLSRTTPKLIIAGAVVIAILLLTGIAFITTRPSPPVITVRHVKRVRPLIYGITETFALTNHTARRVVCHPVEIEALNGDVWEQCFQVQFKPFLVSNLGPHEHTFCSFETIKLPVGRPLRLRMAVQVEVKGISGFIARIKWRLRLRHLGSKVSLNPFDRSSTGFSDPAQIQSEEFIESEANQ